MVDAKPSSPLVQQFRDLFATRNAEEQASDLREIEIFRRQQILANTIATATPPLPAAQTFLAEPGIIEHLRSTPHLGILQDQVEIQASRYDYVLLWGSILLRFKGSHPGLGLGSNAHFDKVGAIKINGRKISKIEMLQVIAVLVNYGHLFGTFSTERALLFHLYVEPQLKREFIATIDPRLKPLVTDLVDGTMRGGSSTPSRLGVQVDFRTKTCATLPSSASRSYSCRGMSKPQIPHFNQSTGYTARAGSS